MGLSVCRASVQKHDSPKEVEMKRTVDSLVATIVAAGLVVFAPLCAGAEAARWSYTGPNGPAKWGKLDKAFATCASGTPQSPIDILDAHVRKGDLTPLLFTSKPSPLTTTETGHPI